MAADPVIVCLSQRKRLTCGPKELNPMNICSGWIGSTLPTVSDPGPIHAAVNAFSWLQPKEQLYLTSCLVLSMLTMACFWRLARSTSDGAEPVLSSLVLDGTRACPRRRATFRPFLCSWRVSRRLNSSKVPENQINLPPQFWACFLVELIHHFCSRSYSVFKTPGLTLLQRTCWWS